MKALIPFTVMLVVFHNSIQIITPVKLRIPYQNKAGFLLFNSLMKYIRIISCNKDPDIFLTFCSRENHQQKRAVYNCSYLIRKYLRKFIALRFLQLFQFSVFVSSLLLILATHQIITCRLFLHGG